MVDGDLDFRKPKNETKIMAFIKVSHCDRVFKIFLLLFQNVAIISLKVRQWDHGPL